MATSRASSNRIRSTAHDSATQSSDHPQQPHSAIDQKKESLGGVANALPVWRMPRRLPPTARCTSRQADIYGWHESRGAPSAGTRGRVQEGSEQFFPKIKSLDPLPILSLGLMQLHHRLGKGLADRRDDLGGAEIMVAPVGDASLQAFLFRRR